MVGSGAGPTVNVERFGPSILIDAGSQLLLFDCGRGATIRLTQLGIPLARVNKVFLTHLHSDHIIDLPDLFLTAPAGFSGRKVPLEVWGPAGTRDMMDYMQRAFAFDLHVRRDEERWSKEGLSVISHDIEQGTVFDNDGVKVSAFLVDHGPVKPAFGFRIDYRGRSVALSGDTRFSENLIKYAQGVDVLIHEAASGDYSRATTREQREQLEFVTGIHTLPEQAAEVFNRVKAKLAVYAHAPEFRVQKPQSDLQASRLSRCLGNCGEPANVRRSSMPSNPLTELLKLPPGDRADLAMSLWESLSDLEREGQLDLSEAEGAELDRRWAEHLANPESAIPWSVVRSKLRG